MKRFDQWSQRYRKNGTPNNNGEKKPRGQDKKSFDDTKKHLGFQWDIPDK
jgi:hypothetical protein